MPGEPAASPAQGDACRRPPWGGVKQAPPQGRAGPAGAGALRCRAGPALTPLVPQIYALNRVMTELEQQQFDAFCKQMQAAGD